MSWAEPGAAAEWRISETSTKILVSPFSQESVFYKARQALCPLEKIEKPHLPCDSGALSNPSLRIWETLGLLPAPWPRWLKALDTPCLYKQSGCQSRQTPARQGVSGACSPLFVYLVSVVTEGAGMPELSLGQHSVGVPAVPTHKAPTPSTHPQGIFFQSENFNFPLRFYFPLALFLASLLYI